MSEPTRTPEGGIILTSHLGGLMAQTKEFIPFFEDMIFQRNIFGYQHESPPSLKPERIIEIGTDRGNLAVYFLSLCINIGAKFVTYDIIDNTDHSTLKNLLGFYNSLRIRSCWDDEQVIRNLISEDGRTILFCDGGDKIKEFNTFASSLKVGDIIGCHDWDMEISMTDIQDEIKKCGLKPVGHRHPFMEASVSRFFMKVK